MNHRLWVIRIVIIVTALVTIFSLFLLVSLNSHTRLAATSSKDFPPLAAVPEYLKDFGTPMAVEEAEKLLGIKLLPSYLPPSTTLLQVWVKNHTATLLFKNLNLRKLPFFNESVQIMLFVSKRSLPKPLTKTLTIKTYTIVKDETAITTTVTKPLLNCRYSLRRVLVNGSLGYYAEFNGDTPAILIWQQGNYTYVLRAYLPLDELLKIASSI